MRTLASLTIAISATQVIGALLTAALAWAGRLGPEVIAPQDPREPWC